MGKKPLRVTGFHSGRELCKPEHEKRIGRLFAEGYEQKTGIKLEGNNRGGDPPDRLFSYRNLIIGVEMFELGQFHEARALFEALEDEICSELELRVASKRYEGIGVELGILKDTKIPGALRKGWRQKGTRKARRPALAKQFVDLLLDNVSSRDAVPEGGLPVPVDPRLYPAVAVLTKKVIIRRRRIHTSSRTDGQAAPLVTTSPGYLISPTEIEEGIKDSMEDKISQRPDWKSPVDYSVLVAHDVPRGRVHEPLFTGEAHKWLRSAASEVNLLQAFDELWFVTPLKIAGRNAQRVCGRELGRHSG